MADWSMTAMATKRDVIRYAKKLGAELTINGADPLDAEVHAPAGHHWACCGAHSLIGSQWDDEPRSAVWDDMLVRMESGLEECGKECEAAG